MLEMCLNAKAGPNEASLYTNFCQKITSSNDPSSLYYNAHNNKSSRKWKTSNFLINDGLLFQIIVFFTILYKEMVYHTSIFVRSFSAHPALETTYK